MKKKLLMTLSGSVILLVGMAAGALASTQLQEIKAYLNGELKVRANGQIVSLKDGNGKTVLPITYNGTTYLPVRSVSSLLGVAVNYNAQAKEVVIGEQQAGVPINKEDFNNTLYSKDSAQTTFNGKDYGEVLYSVSGSNIKYTALSPLGKYTKLILQFAATGQDVDAIEIKDIDKNTLLKKVGKISTSAGIQTIEVSISGVSNISIDVTQPVDGGFIIPLTTSYYK
jgi:hypothetical protein